MGARAWTRANVEIDLLGAKMTVQGYVNDQTPGLAVTPLHTHPGWWVVTHIPSGWAPGPSSQDVENVLGLAHELATLGDWTREAQAIWSDRAFCDRAAVILDLAMESGEYRDFERPGTRVAPSYVQERTKARRERFREVQRAHA